MLLSHFNDNQSELILFFVWKELILLLIMLDEKK